MRRLLRTNPLEHQIQGVKIDKLSIWIRLCTVKYTQYTVHKWCCLDVMYIVQSHSQLNLAFNDVVLYE